MPESPAATALALLAVPGVGRVTAHRLLAHFASVEELQATPREQVYLRIKSSPKASDLTARLMDGDTLSGLVAEKAREVSGLAEKGIFVLTPRHPDWPATLNALPESARPVVLYAYGNTSALGHAKVAFLARPPVPGPDFEQAQTIARAALARQIGIILGSAHGFDLALSKLAADARVPSVAMLNCGLAKLAPSFRPAATALVRSGGLLLSSFPMQHGPFEHDDDERATVQSFLASAVVGVATRPETPEARAAALIASTVGGPVLGSVGATDPGWPDGTMSLDDRSAIDGFLGAAAT